MPHKPTRYGTLNDRVGHDAQEVLVMLPLPLACRVMAHTAPCGHPIQPPQPTQRLDTGSLHMLPAAGRKTHNSRIRKPVRPRTTTTQAPIRKPTARMHALWLLRRRGGHSRCYRTWKALSMDTARKHSSPLRLRTNGEPSVTAPRALNG